MIIFQKQNFKTLVEHTDTASGFDLFALLYRVANLAQNSEEFSQAYSCGRGTQMNPEVKCSSFPELREMDGSDSDLSPQ